MTGKVQGSFRDPDGHVYTTPRQVFRGITHRSAAFVREFLKSDFYEARAGTLIVSTKEVVPEDVCSAGIPEKVVNAYELWVEHERIPLITYPYEWCLESLKQAADLTLTLLVDALNHGYVLKDASAYNVQFINSKPIFIDFLSFAPYEQDTPFAGYKQFCEHFFAPLCLTAFAKIEFNSWFRGRLDGLDLMEVSNALPFRTNFRLSVLAHIHFHAKAIEKAAIAQFHDDGSSHTPPRPVPKKNLIALARGLQRSISNLERRGVTKWQNYECCNSYSESSKSVKAEILSNFVRKHRIRRIFDLGCNTGEYTKLAIRAGARSAVGVDFDCGSVNIATKDAVSNSEPIQYLVYDVENPSPNLGWMSEERISLEQRLGTIDGLLCFALIHHVVITRNIPLDEFVRWVLNFAPRGLVEFVPKKDPMTEKLLLYRQDVFHDYDQQNFERSLSSECDRFICHELPSSDRLIYEFER